MLEIHREEKVGADGLMIISREVPGSKPWHLRWLQYHDQQEHSVLNFDGLTTVERADECKTRVPVMADSIHVVRLALRNADERYAVVTLGYLTPLSQFRVITMRDGRWHDLELTDFLGMFQSYADGFYDLCAFRMERIKPDHLNSSFPSRDVTELESAVTMES